MGAGTSHAEILVTSTAATIAQGSSGDTTYSISGVTTPLVATYNAEVAFDAASLDIDCTATNCGCVLDPRLTDQTLQVTRPTTGSLIFFVGDTTNPIGTFGDGAMFKCTFKALPAAAPNTYSFDSTFLEVGDALGNVLAANAEYGDITVILPPPTPTITPTSAATNTATAVPTNTATQVPTHTNTVPPSATRTVTSTPNNSASSDDGCNMNPNAGAMSLWLLLPLAALPLARQRRGR
jgi:hypothetical protein